MPHLEALVNNVYCITERDRADERVDKIWDSDVIIVSVPISHTVQVIRELSEYVLDDKLIIDVSGLKTKNTPVLADLDASEKISIHPMFLPNLESFQWKNIITALDQGWVKWAEMKCLLGKSGINLTSMTPQEHDTKMGHFQNVPHILTLLYTSIFAKSWWNIDDLSHLATPNVELLNLISGRLFSNNGATFGEMMMNNSMLKEQILPMMEQQLAELSEIIHTWDTQRFNDIFWQLQWFFWKEFIDEQNSLSNTALASFDTNKK